MKVSCRTAPNAPGRETRGPFPTAAEIHAQIDGWSELGEGKQRCLKSALRLLERVYRRPLETIRLDPAELSKTFLGVSVAALGIKPSSLATYRGDLRFVLRRLGLIERRRRSTEAFLPEWLSLRDALSEGYLSISLQSFMAFCSDRGTLPPDVSEETLLTFLTALRSRRLTGDPTARLRQVVRGWRKAQSLVPAWPQTILRGPDLGRKYAPSLSPALAAEVSAWTASMTAGAKESLFSANAPRQPLSRATVQVRTNSIGYALAALKACGTPPEDIHSLSVLVQPEHVKSIIDWHWNRAGRKVTDHLGTIADTLRVIAKYWVRLTGPALEEVLELVRRGKPPKRSRMTANMERRLRQFDDPDNEARLLHLPRLVMKVAGDMLRTGQKAPEKPHMMREAAWLAGIAVAIAIELRCPMRIKNLVNLRYGVHVIKLDSRCKTWTHLMVEVEETKNGVPIRWPVDSSLADLIDEYNTKFRSRLRYSDTDFVFPSRDHPDQPRSKGGLGHAISEVIHRFIGIELSTHNFRAFAGWQLLKDNAATPDDLRQILGHTTMNTALIYYQSHRPQEAAQRFNALVNTNEAKTKLRAAAAFSQKGYKGAPKRDVHAERMP